MQPSPTTEPTAESSVDTPTFNPLDAILLLRSASGELITHLILHGQLLQVEWAEQKKRLLQIFLVTLLGFAGLLCFMVLTGLMVLAISWETSYRIPAAAVVMVFYLLVIVIAWLRFQTLSVQSSQAFAVTREELAADIAVFKRKP